MSEDNYIYIIKDIGNKYLYKISISKHPPNRIKQLLTENLNNLKLIFDICVNKKFNIYQVEKTIYDYLKEKDKWFHGEWFIFDDDDDVIKFASTLLSMK